MNNIFHKLANDAWVDAPEGQGYGGKIFSKEKFSELLVRECAKFMDENSGYNDSDGCWFPEPEDMLKHFGVEE